MSAHSQSSHIQRMDSEDQETLMFHSYACAYYVQSPYACAYYVQSPSTISHANSADIRNNTIDDHLAFHSPTRSETTTGTSTFLNKNNNLEVSRFTLSRSSSSRGSNHSFLHEKKVSVDDIDGHAAEIISAQKRLIIVDHRHHHGVGDDGDDDDANADDDDDDDDEGWYYGSGKKSFWWRYFSFRGSSSCAWICLQMGWRLLLSLGVALLVFYIATKPPSPNISIRMAGIRQFGLGEGVDSTGVTTKVLTCNCSIDLLIDNKSKLFGLHIHPPVMQMFFGRLPFALSQGPKLYAVSQGSSSFELYVGTKNKPMYGAGRNMQDMLESGMGLPLIIRMNLRSNYRVVWDLIKPKFHHQAECLLFLNSKYDKKHRTQSYNSTCTITS